MFRTNVRIACATILEWREGTLAVPCRNKDEVRVLRLVEDVLRRMM